MAHIVPRGTQQFLTRFGGRNPYGLPQWRIIVAADVMVKEAGVYRDWADGMTNAEKGGINFTPYEAGLGMQRYDNKPIRVVTEMRETQKYPGSEGWILEKWFPASSYGSRDDWHTFKAIDGITPMLGPYPERGDYEFIFGPWPKVPSTDVLQGYVSRYVAGISAKTGTPESRAREYVQRYEYQQQQAEEKRKAEYMTMFRDELTPMHSSSLGASRWRNELAVNAGIQGHIGIL